MNSHEFVSALLAAAAALTTAAGCAGPASHAGGSAVIENTGSTNAPGFRIEVAAGGAVTWHNNAARNLPNELACGAADGSGAVDVTLAQRLLDDLQTAGESTGLRFDECPHSVSFGTHTTVTYGPSHFADVECGSASNSLAAAITRDVDEVQRAVAAACH